MSTQVEAVGLHPLDTSEPLQTPFGPVPLPPESPIPERLTEIANDYEEP